MRNDLRQFNLRDAVIESFVQMEWKLLASTKGDEGAHRDKTAVTLR